MTVEAQRVVLGVDVRATGVHIVAPHEISRHGQSTSAGEFRKGLLHPTAFRAYHHLKGDGNGHGRRHFNWILALVLLVVFVCPLLFAVDDERNIHQYAHTAWGAKEGCPSAIQALAQTRDGYIWLGTAGGGLYRFDGVSFERYEPPARTAFPLRTIRSLLALPNGDLWIGSLGAISVLRSGRLTNYGTQEGVPDGAVKQLAQDREGTIWAATGAGLARLEGQQWNEVGKDWEYPGKSAGAVFLDDHGTLWVATENTIVFLPAGNRKFQATGLRVGQLADFSQAANGKLWMAETTNSVRPIPSRSSQLPSDDTEIRVGSVAILFDNDGVLWVTSIGDGMRRAPSPAKLHGTIGEFSGVVESFTTKDGLTGDDGRAILQDREGSIWVATLDGLDRFRRTNVVPFSLPINPQQTSFATGGDPGEIWVNNLGEVTRIQGLRAYPEGLKTKTASSVYRDPAGVIWWVSAPALYGFQSGRYSRIGLPKEITRSYSSANRLTRDRSGMLWLAAEREGLFYMKKVWKRLPLPPELARLTPVTAFTDWRGYVWIAYAGGKIITFDPGKADTPVSVRESPVGTVKVIEGGHQHVWFGGELGVALFDGSNFQAVVPSDATIFENVLGLAEVSDGSLWLSDRLGIIHIPSPEVDKARYDASYRVRYELFDSLDGLSGSVLKGPIEAVQTQGARDRLWFLTTNGMAWLNTAEILRNPVPPPVSIKFVTAAREQYSLLTNLVLPPRTANLQIGYTALSLAVPERVRFRYKLEGIDKDWQDAGTRREAFYTQLGPGKYRFHVIACNNDGVWNEEGAFLDFSIAPAWYQTSLFRGFCGVVSLLLLWSLYRLRLQQAERRFAVGLEARVNERTRIARELHDTLLQGFQGLLLRFQAATNLLPNRPDEAKRRLEGAIDQAAQAITEGRDAVHELRSSTVPVSDLDVALRSLAEQLMADYGGENPPEFSLQVEGTPRDLQPILRDEVYRIAGEALRNAFRHGSAGRVEVEIRYDKSRLRLRLRDDGKGIDAKLLDQDARPGHWGLPGMRERAKLIGARLDVWSNLNSGTEVELSVPSSLAYATPGSRRSLFPSWLGRASSRREKA